MDQDETPKTNDTPRRHVNPELRREVSRRNLITGELGQATKKAVSGFPSVAGVLGFALRESPAQRDERMVGQLWQLLMGRAPKAEESAAGLDLVRNAQNPDDKADALVDILWALCQTTEFEALDRSDGVLVRGIYRIAMNRDPRDDEKKAALDVLGETDTDPERVAALEGLFTGLLRSGESVLRQEPAPTRRWRP